MKKSSLLRISMTKLYISLLATILCTQQTQGMEKQLMPAILHRDAYCRIVGDSDNNFNTPERFVHVQSTRFRIDGPCILTQIVDTLSLKLYNKNLNENEIEELVKQGANVNYKEPDFLNFHCTVPTFHATNDTEQGIKNMQKLIALGAHLHFTKIQDHTPLGVAAEKNITPMIELLLPYEKIETSTDQEKITRNIIIYQSFQRNNFEVIKKLLELQLMTPNQGLDNFISCTEPNEKIFNYLIDKGANNYHDHLNETVNKTFAYDNRKIEMLDLFTNHGAFNRNVLLKLYTMKVFLDRTIKNLENNDPQNHKDLHDAK